MTDFAEALTYLTAEDPAANVTRIKDAVSDNIRAADARVVINRTDHFNHSYVPDFVLHWGGDVEDRSVFLRTSYNIPALREDVDALGGEKPILLSLERLPGPVDAQAESSLARESRSERTLIADPFGLEALRDQVSDRPVVSLFSHAVLQGGKGIIDSETAVRAGNSIGLGFEAARRAEPQGTGRAVETSEDLLDTARAGALNRLLHAVWVGSGASGTTFPGASGVTSLLDGEALRFLLELPKILEPDFWKRVGRDMTLARLCGAANALETANLQLLMAACAGRLQAKACRVISSDRALDDLAWSIRGDSLQLELGSRKVQFVPRAVSEFADAGPLAEAPTLEALRDRARSAGVLLAEVHLESDTRRAAYGSSDQHSIADGEDLMGLHGALGADFSVAAVSVRLSPTSSRTMDCTFATGTATGKTSSRFTLAEFVEAAVPILAEGLLPSEAEQLRLATSADASDSPGNDT